MQPLEPAVIRRAFVNSSRSRVAAMALPEVWPPHRVEDRDFLGWVDPKAPQRGYLVLGEELVDEPVAVELRFTTPTGPRRATMCDWCHTDDGTSTARLVVAPRAGARGKAGDTVGQYVCEDLGCSLRARRPLKAHEKSVTGAPDLRVEDLRARVLRFVDRVRER